MNYGKIIGVGNTAVVYEWKKDKVLKLFNEGYPKEAVEREFHNAMVIRNMDFEKPKAYELLSYEGRMGIVYDRVDGESLLHWLMRTGNIQGCAVYMAKLHKEIINNRVDDLNDYKQFLKYHTVNSASISLAERNYAMETIEKLPEGNLLCHGDFHPGNIILSEGNAIVIDFMNLCKGDYMYDIARSVFLIEYTPVPPVEGKRDELLRVKKVLADLYLAEMNVKREMIKDYIEVMKIVRKSECPNE